MRQHCGGFELGNYLATAILTSYLLGVTLSHHSLMVKLQNQLAKSGNLFRIFYAWSRNVVNCYACINTIVISNIKDNQCPIEFIATIDAMFGETMSQVILNEFL